MPRGFSRAKTPASSTLGQNRLPGPIHTTDRMAPPLNSESAAVLGLEAL